MAAGAAGVAGAPKHEDSGAWSYTLPAGTFTDVDSTLTYTATLANALTSIVTAILSDFRGLDTMGEITVIGITMLGLLTLLQRPSNRRGGE